MKKLIALVMALVLVLGLVACAPAAGNEGGSDTGSKGTIAVIAKGESHAFWQAVKSGAEKAAKEKGYELTFQGPASEDPKDTPSQVTMVQTALSNNVKGIVLATIGSGFGECLTQAYDKKIPVVTFDSGLKAPEDITKDKNPIVAHVATSNKAAANINGEKLFEAVKAEIAKATEANPYVIGVIQHDETNTGIDRAGGFEEKFKALADADETTKGKYKIEKEIKQGDADQSYVKALEALYEKGIKALFMTNEGVVKQVYDAAKSAEGKYDSIIFSGFDAGTKQLTWIKENATPKLVGSVAQDSIDMGYKAVLECITAVEGGTAKNVDIAGAWYTAENLIAMLDSNLIYTDAPEDADALRK